AALLVQLGQQGQPRVASLALQPLDQSHGFVVGHLGPEPRPSARVLAASRRPAPSPESQPMIVLGIDPGTAHTGYGVVRRRSGRLSALDGGVIETRADMAPERRLTLIHGRVLDLLDQHEPDALALED